MNDNAFFRAFNPSLNAAQKVMGEKFEIDASEWDAIAVDELDADTRAEWGGKLADVSTTILVSSAIAQQSGAAIGKVVTVRGTRLRISDTKNEGDDSVTLFCGPVGLSSPRK
jgi:hypothetical protein